MIKKVAHKLHHLGKTDLFKTSFWNGIATIIKMGTGIISNKIVAIYLGPSGIALLGQFTSFTGILSTIAGTGTGSGITKYIAEYRENNEARKNIISTGFISALIITCITSVVVFVFAGYFCESILKSRHYISVFYVFGATLILFSINGFLVAVLNGFKEFKKIILINIISSLFGLLITVFFTMRYGISGALLSTVLSVSLISFVTFIFVYRSPWFKLSDFIGHFEKSALKKLMNYALMAFVSIFAVMYMQLAIRSYLIEHLSIQQAGYWQGIIRISEIFLSVITITLGIYYLPRLSEIKTDGELRTEIIKGYKFLIPLTILGSVMMYICKDFIISVLFTPDFKPMTELFFWQLLGNIFKIASWLIAFLMLARAMTKIYIITEIIFGLSLYGLTVLFTHTFGLVGATIAYCINYFLYFIVMMIIFRKILFQTAST